MRKASQEWGLPGLSPGGSGYRKTTAQGATLLLIAIERIAAGENEAEVMKDYGYIYTDKIVDTKPPEPAPVLDNQGTK